MQKNYIKNIYVLLLILVVNVSIVRAEIFTFSLSDFNIVRNVDTVQITTDNPNYFYSNAEGLPEIPYTIISLEVPYNYYDDYNDNFAHLTYDIEDLKTEKIFDNIYLYANLPPLNPGDPIPPREISTHHALDPVLSLSAEVKGGWTILYLVFSPFIYDNYERSLYFINYIDLTQCYIMDGILPNFPPNSISPIETDPKKEKQYDLSGRSVETHTHGVTIKVSENPDGSRETKKIIVK